ncbi:hypothetical protein EC973_007724 [Apophysomyces ossiformis]|uniref:Protein kinase domain-containing protein n=1 Tax=Apophysomyces ossiformis TaxID=679940 RepID=A0A8H7ESX3_9FUNG|nr:hypothetical protein EC973_007724 [Apophysomyces ossiformis]
MLACLKQIFRPQKKIQQKQKKKSSIHVISYTRPRYAGHPKPILVKTNSRNEQKPGGTPQSIENDKQKNQKTYPVLDGYEFVQKLGDGAFSDVYKARQKSTNRYVAVKVAHKHRPDQVGKKHLHPSMKKKPKATERANILKEVQIMRDISHPNIVQLIHFCESNEHYFLVLELSTGGELFQRIVEFTYFSEPLSRHVMVQVAEAVRYLHEECGIVHRDIKPENILYDPIPWIPSKTPPKKRAGDGPKKKDEGEFIPGVGGGGIGRVKLADFGLSKVIWGHSTATPCGTMGYTAPEIMRDQTYSKAVDLWAIGCVLYTILSGFPPFYDESISALTEKVARGKFAFLSPWWDPVSDAAKDLISHLLCVDPNKRYTIHQLLKHSWMTEDPFEPETIPSPVSVATTTPLLPAPVASTVPSASETLEPAVRRKDVFSAGVPTLKEILDITYACHRMGEDVSTVEDGHLTVHRGREAMATELARHRRGVPPPSAEPNQSRDKGATFELCLDHATLLRNRRENNKRLVAAAH